MANGHIILPKSTLLRFSDVRSGSFCYLDLHDHLIKIERAANFYTCEEYYPPQIEKLLSDKVESVLGRIYAKLDILFDDHTDTYCLPEALFADIIMIIAIQRMRMPKMFKFGAQKSVIGQFINWPDPSSMLQFEEYNIDEGIGIFEKIFKDYTPTVSIIDGCSASFVLPSSHCFTLDDYWYFVLSPDRAIALCPNYINLNDNGIRGFEVIDDNDFFVCYYSDIIHNELKYGEGFLVGLRPELEKIQYYIKAGKL